VLVGKTSLALSVEGITFEKGGAAEFTTDASRVMRLNRTTDDGSILELNKNGATVGSIGTSGGSAYISGPSNGVRFTGTTIAPSNNTGGTADGAIQLGYSTDRFKDLYLSGGVYLGGTGAANKLDDYEEGAWTPTSASGTLTYAIAKYTKVGRKVTIIIQGCTFSDITTANTIDINGLPFAVTNHGSGVGLWQYNNTDAGLAYCFASTINFYPISTTGGGYSSVKHSSLAVSSNSVYVTATYFT